MDMLDTLPVTDFDLERERLGDLASQDSTKLDNQLRVRFYKRAVLNSFESEKQQRKVFDDKVYIEILMPANLKNVIDREATSEDRRRFSRQFQHFVATGEQLTSGTPLSELVGLPQSQVAELRALKIETIEQLAGVADSTIQLIGTGGMTLKMRAKRWLEERMDRNTLLLERDSLAESNAKLLAELEQLRAAADNKPADAAPVTITDKSK